MILGGAEFCTYGFWTEIIGPQFGRRSKGREKEINSLEAGVLRGRYFSYGARGERALPRDNFSYAGYEKNGTATARRASR